jgi:hypothetical protein
MKNTLLAAAALILSTGAAFAVEGGQDPFAQNLPGVTTTVPAHNDTGSMAYPKLPVHRQAAVAPAYARLLPTNSSMPPAQTPNSLPRGFSAAAPRHGG